jgi:hypothetical protein
MRKHDEFWGRGGGRKMRHHDAPTIARQAAAHIQRNVRGDPGKDWMGGPTEADPQLGGRPPQVNVSALGAKGPDDAVQPMSPGQMQLD